MSYVIFHKDTTKIVRIMRNGYWQDARFETERAAKSGLTRLVKKTGIDADEHAIAEYNEFRNNVEKTETRKGIVGAAGKDFVVGVNTPWSSGPWSESYWCN
jgi:hypothetical protein